MQGALDVGAALFPNSTLGRREKHHEMECFLYTALGESGANTMVVLMFSARLRTTNGVWKNTASWGLVRRSNPIDCADYLCDLDHQVVGHEVLKSKY
jgi:hypothetical protein